MVFFRAIKVEIEWFFDQNTNEDQALKIQRIFRPLWPYFKPKSKQEIYKELRNEAGRSQTNVEGGA